MIKTKHSKAFALPLVLTLLLVATVGLAYMLKDSVNKVFYSMRSSTQQEVHERASSQFESAKDILLTVLTPILSESGVGNTLVWPDHELQIGVLPASTEDLIAEEDFLASEHSLLQHEAWGLLESTDDNDSEFLEVQVEIVCLGEQAAGGFAEGICSISNSRFPKSFRMIFTARDAKDPSLYTTISADLLVAPLSLNDFSLVLTDSDRVIFGNGVVNGNVSINLGSEAEDVLFLNGDQTLTLNGLFQISDPDRMFFGYEPDSDGQGSASSNYKFPEFLYGVQNTTVAAGDLVQNFNELTSQPGINVINLERLPNPDIPLLPDEVVHNLTFLKNRVKFGEVSEDVCEVEMTSTYEAVAHNPVLAGSFTCGSQPAESGDYFCICPTGTVFCLRPLGKIEDVNFPQAALEDNTVIKANELTTEITSLDPSEATAKHCGSNFTLLAPDGDIIFERSFEQVDLDVSNWKNEEVSAAFVSLGQEKGVRLNTESKLNRMNPSTGDFYTVFEFVHNETGEPIAPGDSGFRIDAAIVALGDVEGDNGGRFEVPFLSNIPSISEDRRFGGIDLNGSIISKRTPLLRRLREDGSTRIGFSEVRRTFIPPSAPGFNRAVASSLRVSVTNVSYVSFRAKEAFDIAGVEDPRTLP